MKKTILLIFVLLLVVAPIALSKTNCEELNELKCRRSNECIPLYGQHFLVFSYDYEKCVEGTPIKRNYMNEFSGTVFNFIEDNFKGVDIAATTDTELEIEGEEGLENEIQSVVYGKEKTVYIYAGSKLLAKIKDV